MPDPTASLATPYRTHTCGQLRADDAGATARLSGWVHRRRDHGQLIFLDLRDRHGLTQVVIDKTEAPGAHEIASRVRGEFVVRVDGVVARRLAGTENPKLPTGEIELRGTAVAILSEAKTPPFYINEPDAPVDESLRLKYRYLDIRRQPMADRLLLRSRMVQAIREVHHANGFVEVETPTLIKSTPEGARDFIVPSRLQPGSVYALPQSPQQLKQLLMVAGMDRYFQIARCYRDEDLRGDRQPEFTQLDLEMSFVDEEAVMGFIETMAIEVSRATTPERPIQQVPFPRFTYDEVIERFGSDKPDLRFGMELVDLAPALTDASGAPASGFGVFDGALAAGGRVKAIAAPGLGGATRKELDELTERAKRFGAKGLVHLAPGPEGLRGPAAKFLGDDVQRRIVALTGAGDDDLILAVADRPAVTADVLGRLRAELGERLGLADPTVLAYVWINRFPMYQWDEENGRWDATHNPFSGVVRPGPPLAGRPGRPRPGAPVRPRPQRLGAGGRLRAHPSPRSPGAQLPTAGAVHRGHAREVRGDPRCLRVRRPAARRDRPGYRPLGGPPRYPDEHPRGHGLSQDPVRLRPDARGAVATRGAPVRGARAALRRRAEEGRRRRDRVTGPDRPMAHAAVGDPPFVRQTALAGPAPAVVAATGDRTGWWSARLGALLADPRGEVDA
jgi:aspartyl-tRNA synthetase